MADIQLTCKCGIHYDFTERDQAFFASKGWGKPKRCHKCRIQKKEDRKVEEKRADSPFFPAYEEVKRQLKN